MGINGILRRTIMPTSRLLAVQKGIRNQGMGTNTHCFSLRQADNPCTSGASNGLIAIALTGRIRIDIYLCSANSRRVGGLSTHNRIPFNGREYLSPHTCADAIEPVLLGLSAPLEIPALEDIATQLAVTSNQAMNVDPADNESAAAETGACRSSIEQIQHELHLASLRQVEIQKRI